ncbi:hypothetical protein ACOSP7_027152 [Xanthoceras sorbifolium]
MKTASLPMEGLRWLSAANIPTHQQISILEMEAGGIQNIGCTKTDIYNYERDLRNAMKGHDAELLYEYFESEQEKNSSFTFKIKAGDDDRIIHCFWADTVSRRAYKYFGDVVVFDTTYNTNRYGMIFAPLIGVNHHGQSIVFAYAFLSDETTDSFLWLFDQFKEAMPGNRFKMGASVCESYFLSWNYVSKKNSLMDFILRFNRALAHQRYEELIADHTDSNGTLIGHFTYSKINFGIPWFIKLTKKKWRMVIVVCIKLIKGKKLLIELEKSFMKRRVVLHHAVISDFQDKLMLTRCTRLFQLASNIIENVVGSEEASKILEDDLNNVLSKVKSVVSSDSISERHSSTPQIYNEPLAVRAKGCGKRLKGGKEKAKGKTTDNSRRCNGCGKIFNGC